jgi:hypothetical protein
MSWRQAPLLVPRRMGQVVGTPLNWRSSPIDCTQLGLELRSGARVSSNVNGTTACTSHVCGKTGARQIIEGSTEYGAYSWAICGWTSNSGLSPTRASWAIAAEAKMNIDPAARTSCKDFLIVFLRRVLFTHRRIEPRRKFITLLGGAVAARPLAACASSRR